jgi:hypothetical protein
MRKTSTNKAKGKKNRPRTKLGIPDLEHSKAAVLRSLGSPDSVRGYLTCRMFWEAAMNSTLDRTLWLSDWIKRRCRH